MENLPTITMIIVPKLLAKAEEKQLSKFGSLT